MLSLSQVFIAVFAMALVIFLTRALPFIFFSFKKDSPSLEVSEKKNYFILFVERVVPPVAMTALAVHALFSPFLKNLFNEILHTGVLHIDRLETSAFAGFFAALFTALLHLWRRNALLSIGGGTVLYMLFIRFGVGA